MDNPLISIIIPVYNTEKYLRQCLDSVVAQTYTNWECLLIDDGSKDASGAICDDYAAKDPRFRVFHKENGGVSSARNLGLEESKGEWITFSDSDDQLALDAFATYIRCAIKSKSDIIRCGFDRLFSDGVIISVQVSEPILITNKGELLRFIWSTQYKGFLWNSCFHKILVENTRFNLNFNNGEDHLFSYELYRKASSVYFVPDVVYKYREHPYGSLSYPKDPYMVIAVATAEYEVKKDLFKDDYEAQKIAIRAYQNKMILSIKTAILHLDSEKFSEYYNRTMTSIQRFSKRPEGGFAFRLLYTSFLPLKLRIPLVKLIVKRRYDVIQKNKLSYEIKSKLVK